MAGKKPPKKKKAPVKKAAPKKPAPKKKKTAKKAAKKAVKKAAKKAIKKAVKKAPIKKVPRKKIPAKKAAPKKAAVKKAAEKKAVKENELPLVNTALGDEAMPIVELTEPASPAALQLSTTEREVREIIISSAGGLGGTQPDDLKDIMSLKDNLNYTPTDFNVLQGALDSYVKGKKPNKGVTSSDISNNKTVGSITDMVKSKII